MKSNTVYNVEILLTGENWSCFVKCLHSDSINEYKNLLTKTYITESMMAMSNVCQCTVDVSTE